MNPEPVASVHWSDPLEDVVRKQAEQCQALAWAHEESQRWCSNWNTRLMFPSIILAAFSGAGAIGADKLLPFDGSTTLVGIVSLFVGTLQTVQNYFAFAKRSEAHRIASLQYNKMHASLATTLALPRSERKTAGEIIEWLQTESERLTEVVPLIPQAIKDKFTGRFHGLENFSIPPNLNGLVAVGVTRVDTLVPPTVVRPVVHIGLAAQPAQGRGRPPLTNLEI